MKYSIFNRTRVVAALACTFLVFAGFAHAKEQPKKGTLKITVATEVSGLMLEPGEYELKQVKSANGPVIRFTHYTYNPYAQEGVSTHQWDVVGEIRVAVQSQDSKAVRTQLLTESNSNKLVGLQIRGNSFQYLFVTA
jgi:hypothetical protein